MMFWLMIMGIFIHGSSGLKTFEFDPDLRNNDLGIANLLGLSPTYTVLNRTEIGSAAGVLLFGTFLMGTAVYLGEQAKANADSQASTRRIESPQLDPLAECHAKCDSKLGRRHSWFSKR